MQRQRRHALLRRRVELRLELAVMGIRSGMAPAHAVGVQYDVRPIRIVERNSGALEFLSVRLIRDEPLVPDVASECAAVFAHCFLAPRRRHQPVIPIVLRLPITQRLIGRVGSIADRERNTRADALIVQRRGDVRGARAPVVAHQCMPPDIERRRELDQILSQCDELSAAKRGVAQETRRTVTAQPRCVGAKACFVQRRQYRIPSARIVRPAMREDHREAAVGAGDFVADAQQRGLDKARGHLAILQDA